jgi:hypothetical protein
MVPWEPGLLLHDSFVSAGEKAELGRSRVTACGPRSQALPTRPPCSARDTQRTWREGGFNFQAVV